MTTAVPHHTLVLYIHSLTTFRIINDRRLFNPRGNHGALCQTRLSIFNKGLRHCQAYPAITRAFFFFVHAQLPRCGGFPRESHHSLVFRTLPRLVPGTKLRSVRELGYLIDTEIGSTHFLHSQPRHINHRQLKHSNVKGLYSFFWVPILKR